MKKLNIVADTRTDADRIDELVPLLVPECAADKQAAALVQLVAIVAREPSEAMRESMALAICGQAFKGTDVFADAAERYFDEVAPVGSQSKPA